ncbi:hypothetical protein NLJ89_g3029 [Agrocybe chaxingu]|uniref:Aminoglycoside phosphotransferase domain-containing protein n=1 Tax=Agrocybe chaxingu TaxID=84603 RepID=A0A9W8K5G7_9AGAR|nr:hypothetical protein NLJ89_g3029 [Agrocybe chaxingu]
MARINGVVLEEAWDQLPFDTKAIVAEQLAKYISQLRAIPPPPDVRAICSLAGGPVQCHRLHDDGVSGPFRDEDHMNFQLRHCRPMDAYPAFVQSAHSKSHPLVFTHNDLFPRNIMIDQTTGQVLAVLDWESAGWFPSHWEYCKSRNWGIWKPYQQEWMNEWVPKVIPAYEEEAKADRFLMYESGLSSLNPIRHAP